jgi:hypothetical protein
MHGFVVRCRRNIPQTQIDACRVASGCCQPQAAQRTPDRRGDRLTRRPGYTNAQNMLLANICLCLWTIRKVLFQKACGQNVIERRVLQDLQ